MVTSRGESRERAPSGGRSPARAACAVAALWLLLGFANLVRGAGHAGAAYRQWAFDHHSYSDLLAMAGDRYFGGGRPFPYLEDRIEYPPLLGLALWLPSLAPGGPAVYFTLGALLLAACGLAAVALVARMPGADVWWLAGTPALAYYGALNWDLFPIALLVAAVAALDRGRPGRSGALVGLGAAAKLWPVALVPPAVAALVARRERAQLLSGSAAGMATFLTVNLPFAALAPAAWSWFWVFNAQRGAENSCWELLRRVPSLAHLATSARFLNGATLLLLASAAALAAWSAFGAARAGASAQVRAVRLGTAFVLVAWIATAKVWSPQYALWAFAAGALAAAPRWLFAVHAVVAPLDYHVAFETRASRGLIHYFDRLYSAEEVVRLVAYALLLAWLGRELWRAGRARASLASPPAAAPASAGGGAASGERQG